VQLEQLGTPAVVVTTTRFVDLTERVATTIGLPDCRIAVVDHPLGGIDDTAVDARADAIVERIVTLFTGRR
jgi:hypothetical protein